MNPSKLADEILKKIERENITPRSKYVFIAQNIAFWSIFVLAIGLGSISFAIILYAFTHTDFAIGEFVDNQSLLEQWISFLPLLWMLLIGIAIGLGIYGLKHTKRGYRIALITLIGGNILTSVALGSGLYAAGGAEVIEDTLEANVTGYESVREKYQRFWGNPANHGRLAGKVLAVDEANQMMTLEGPRGREYQVPYGEGYPLEQAPDIGTVLKMKGRLEGELQFRPNRLRPALGGQRMQRRIDQYLDQNPAVRSAVEAQLSSETRQELETVRQTGTRPSRELREKIRTEIQSNTTPEQREVYRDNILREGGLSPRLQNAPEIRRLPVDRPLELH